MAIIISNTSFFSEVVIFWQFHSYSKCTEDVIIIVLLSFPACNCLHINWISFLLGESSTVSAEGYDFEVSLPQNNLNVQLNFNCYDSELLSKIINVAFSDILITVEKIRK